MSAPEIGFAPQLEPEDRARADFYALLARLCFSAPDGALLHLLGSAPPLAADADSTRLAVAWARLCAASRVLDPAAVQEEYDALFGGVGKSLISLFGSYYAAAEAPGSAGQFLVELRATLADLGLALQAGQNMPEDHLSALLETMRLLIAGNADTGARTVAEQAAFFSKFIAPWYAKCCSAITNSTIANTYQLVAECTDAFLAIEDESFAVA
jgi:TorA maturation chaperone TorD